MKYFLIFSIVIVFKSFSHSQSDADNDWGYAIVKADTIYGIIDMNFDSGAITIKQDSINRMYLDGIERITLLNEQRDTYLPVSLENRNTFFKVLVDGKYPLITSAELNFALIDSKPIIIKSEKDIYQLFGKREVREYIFLRALDIKEKQDLIDVFQYFNENTIF